MLGVCVLTFLWYYKSSMPVWQGSDSLDVGEELWKWAQTIDDESPSKSNVDWDARREKVRDVFLVSWQGYEKDAWGKMIL